MVQNFEKERSVKRKFIIIVVALLMIIAFLVYDKFKKDPVPEITGTKGNLTEIVSGIPSAYKSDFTEIRSTFSVDETNHAIQAGWEPQGHKYEADFIWFDPDGEEVYRKTMDMEPEWSRTFVHYRGPEPLKAGEWTVAIEVGNEIYGTEKLDVVRNRSEIPIVAQLENFDSEKISLTEASVLTEKIKCFVDGECEKENLFENIPESLAGKKVSLGILIFRDGHKDDMIISSEDKLKDSLSEIDNLSVKPEGSAAVELSVIHSGVDISFKKREISLKMKKKMGFSLKVGDKQATLLPMDIARQDINESTDLLRQLSVDAGLPENGWELPEAKLTAFMTQDFAITAIDGETREYAYSRSVVPVDEVTKKDLEKAVTRTFEWYMRNQLEDGRYMYTYFPDKDEDPDDDWALRNLNGVFVLAEIAKDRDDPEMIKSVRRAIETFRESLVEKNNIRYVDWKKHRPVSSIAGTAFLLAAMAELYDPSYDEDMRMMADAVISLQEESGKLRTDFYRPLKEIDQLYYPGESLLALMRYYKLKKYKPALETVEKAFPFYRDFWSEKENKKGPFVPWQVRAYHEAWEVTGKNRYAEFVFDLTDWLIKRYKPLGRKAGHGRAGAFDTQFASTAVYSEGMAQAYALALELEDSERIKTYGKVLKGNLGYLLGLQFKKEDTYWIKRPGKALGAVPMRPDWNELRLDAAYHAISAVHYTAKLLDEESWDQIEW